MKSFAEHLRERITEEAERLEGEVCEGLAQDFSAYRHMTGQLYAYRRVLTEFSQNARDDMDAT